MQEVHDTMKTRSEYIALLRSSSNVLRERFGVCSLRLFASVARENQKETSDVDVCVERGLGCI